MYDTVILKCLYFFFHRWIEVRRKLMELLTAVWWQLEDYKLPQPPIRLILWDQTRKMVCLHVMFN